MLVLESKDGVRFKAEWREGDYAARHDTSGRILSARGVVRADQHAKNRYLQNVRVQWRAFNGLLAMALTCAAVALDAAFTNAALAAVGRAQRLAMGV